MSGITFTKRMDGPGGRTGPNRSKGNDENRRKYAVDAGFLTGERDRECSNSGSNYSVTKSTRFADLTTSFRIFYDSLLRKELSELEMMKSREALRCAAEKRRMETEAEFTQMLLQTQLQIAAFVAGMGPSRKRKRVEEEETPVSQRERALLLSLLQCNFIL